MPASDAMIPGHKGNRPEDVIVRQKLFLEAYEEHGTIHAACAHTRISRDTYNRWVREDVNNFKELGKNSELNFAEGIEQVVFRRAMEPNAPPVIQMFVLNGLLPDKYRPQAQPVDETAKDVMKKLKYAFKELKFTEKPAEESATVDQQIEDILKSKGS